MMKTHGGDIYGVSASLGVRPEDCLDFSANMNPLGIPGSVKEAMKKSLEELIYYPDPDCALLVHDLSVFHKVPGEMILAGNGAADLIFRLVYGIRPKKALVTAPTFLEYEEALKQTDAKIVHYQLNGKLEVTEDILNCITVGTDLMFICNPNNPTGILTEKKLILDIAKKAEETGTVLVLDECFLDFTEREADDTMVPYLQDFPHIVILKSFTKMFSIPGIRLGYALCSDRELIRKIRSAGQSWSVNTIAAAAGRAALTERDFVKTSAAYVREERDWLTAALKKHGIRVFPGQANYLLIQVEGCPGLYDKMLRYGIMIRRCCNYEGLDETYYRIAVRNHEDNRKLADALDQIIEGEKKKCCKDQED